jgi:DegV family protein with EDD domain
MKDLAIIIDTSTTYSEEFNKKNNIYLIPLSLADSNNKILEDTELSQNQLAENMEKHNIFYKTSASAPGKLIELTEKLLKEYEKVVFFPISYGLSSQYSQAKNIVAPEFPKQFYVVKHNSAANIVEFAIKKFIELTKKRSIETSIEIIEKYILNNCEIDFTIANINGLIRGGRISKIKGLMAKALKINPILRLQDDGTIGQDGKARGMKNVVAQLCESIKNK